MIRVHCEEKNDFYLPIAKNAYKHLRLRGNCSVELILTGSEEIKRLNSEFRGIEKETDVLSFPSLSFDGGFSKFDKKNYPLEYDADSKTVLIGSIVINEVKAREQAAEYGHSENREKAYLFLHGLLHLLGYDHMEDRDKEIMREIEENVLAKIGLDVSGEKGETNK